MVVNTTGVHLHIVYVVLRGENRTAPHVFCHHPEPLPGEPAEREPVSPPSLLPPSLPASRTAVRPADRPAARLLSRRGRDRDRPGRAADARPRRERRERRASPDRRRPLVRARRPVVGAERLHPRLRWPAAPRW